MSLSDSPLLRPRPPVEPPQAASASRERAMRSEPALRQHIVVQWSRLMAQETGAVSELDLGETLPGVSAAQWSQEPVVPGLQLLGTRSQARSLTDATKAAAPATARDQGASLRISSSASVASSGAIPESVAGSSLHSVSLSESTRSIVDNDAAKVKLQTVPGTSMASSRPSAHEPPSRAAAQPVASVPAGALPERAHTYTHARDQPPAGLAVQQQLVELLQADAQPHVAVSARSTPARVDVEAVVRAVRELCVDMGIGTASTCDHGQVAHDMKWSPTVRERFSSFVAALQGEPNVTSTAHMVADADVVPRAEKRAADRTPGSDAGPAFGPQAPHADPHVNASVPVPTALAVPSSVSSAPGRSVRKVSDARSASGISERSFSMRHFLPISPPEFLATSHADTLPGIDIHSFGSALKAENSHVEARGASSAYAAFSALSVDAGDIAAIRAVEDVRSVSSASASIATPIVRTKARIGSNAAESAQIQRQEDAPASARNSPYSDQLHAEGKLHPSQRLVDAEHEALQSQRADNQDGYDSDSESDAIMFTAQQGMHSPASGGASSKPYASNSPPMPPLAVLVPQRGTRTSHALVEPLESDDETDEGYVSISAASTAATAALPVPMHLLREGPFHGRNGGTAGVSTTSGMAARIGSQDGTEDSGDGLVGACATWHVAASRHTRRREHHRRKLTAALGSGAQGEASFSTGTTLSSSAAAARSRSESVSTFASAMSISAPDGFPGSSARDGAFPVSSAPPHVHTSFASPPTPSSAASVTSRGSHTNAVPQPHVPLLSYLSPPRPDMSAIRYPASSSPASLPAAPSHAPPSSAASLSTPPSSAASLSAALRTGALNVHSPAIDAWFHGGTTALHVEEPEEEAFQALMDDFARKLGVSMCEALPL